MKLRDGLSFIIILILMLYAAMAACAGSSRLTATTREKYFILHYDNTDPFLARLIADSAHMHLMRISEQLGYKPDKHYPFNLYVYPSHKGFLDAGGLEIGKYTVGTTGIFSGNISVDASGAFAPVDQVLAHEITHAVISRILGENVAKLPLWINEGLAKYESGDFTDDDKKLVVDAAADGNLIPLKRLTYRFPEKDMALAYAESASAIDYMVMTYGKSTPRKLLHEIALNTPPDMAMNKIAGINLNSFADEWYKHTIGKYYMLNIIRALLATVSFLMAVLAIVAFRRRRRLLAETSADEEED